MAFQVGPELSKHIEADVGGDGDSETARAVDRAGSTGRLPDAGNEGGPGVAAYARKREVLVAVIVAGEKRAFDRVFCSPQKPGLPGNKVAVVFVQCGRYPVAKRPVNHMLREAATEALTVSLSALAPFLRPIFGLPDSGGRGRAEDGLDANQAA